MRTLTPLELLKLNNFIKLHKEDYTDEEKKYILNNKDWGLKSIGISNMFRQIYDELGITDDENNIYIGFIELIKKEFGIDKEIIEVGGGKLPRLSTRIAMQQKKGTITVYDPILINPSSDIPNLKLKKEKFGKETDLNNKQLIIGFMPCEATELMIKRACEENIDFMIALCDGANKHTYKLLDNMDYDWHQEILCETERQIKINNMGTIGIFSLEQYGDPYPVIYNKRLK